VAEYVTQPIGRFPVSVLVVHATHATEVRHEMLECAAMMRRKSVDQTIQRHLALVRSFDFFTPPQLKFTPEYGIPPDYIPASCENTKRKL